MTVNCPHCRVKLADKGRIILRRLKTIRLGPLRPVCQCGRELELGLFG